ncbi:MAG: hypothetical protein B7Y83_06980 [Flavobacteriales bacterium 32-34-25]|nr:MAG: hypothetical protein B7Y83_06980 [Flavobacteriales bacterium 32-34-25]
MKNRIFNLFMCAAVVAAFSLSSCENDNNQVDSIDLGNTERKITVAGALMGTNPGDGNGGTMVYGVSLEDAKNPEKSINVYDDGFHVRSQRTARLQSSEDGNTLFNIAYTGPNGGEFSRYTVNGGNNFAEEDVKVNISAYATASPRWLKLFDGDQTGIAVNLSNVTVTTEADGVTYKHTRGRSTVLSLHLQDVLINTYKQYEIPFSQTEEALGHYISRLDGVVLNKAKNKLIIGVGKGKHNPATGTADNTDYTKISAKSVVVDYPSLENPTVISSTVSVGNTNGYRSFNAFLAEDGNIYQATQRDNGGSRILRIDQNNQYDNSYNFNLDTALGITGTYVDAWRYAGDGIAYILYTHDNADDQGFVARVNLNTKTATLVEGIPYDADLDFSQYQGFVVNGDEVFIAVTPVGKDGNIYILNSKTGTVTKGAKLVNKPGNHYIGIF